MDFLPPASVRIVPHGQSAAVLAMLSVAVVAAAAMVEHPAAVVVLFAAMLGVGWILAATAITSICGGHGLVLEPPGVHGDFHVLSGFRVRAHLGNLRRRRPALFATAELETVVEGVELNSPPLFVARIAARANVPLAWDITVRKRGECDLRGVRVRLHFPGSLVAHECRFPFSHRMFALPAAYSLDRRSLELLVGRRKAVGKTSVTPAAMEEFIGARDYRPGDNPRNIHLALSVRAPNFPEQLVVREFEDLEADDVSVVLDTVIGADELDDATLRYRHEKSLSFTAALCRLLFDHGYRVRLRALDGEATLDMTLTSPVRDLPRMEQRLARLKTSPDAVAFSRLLDRVCGRDSGAIILVGLRDAPAGRHALVALAPAAQTALVRAVAGA